MQVSSGRIAPMATFLEDEVEKLKLELKLEKEKTKSINKIPISDIAAEKLQKKLDNFEIVSTPDNKKVQMLMVEWGEKKRLRYVAILKEGYRDWAAFYFVEYNGGKTV